MHECVEQILEQVDRLTPREYEEFLDRLMDVTLTRQEQAEDEADLRAAADADSAAAAGDEVPVPWAEARKQLGL